MKTCLVWRMIWLPLVLVGTATSEKKLSSAREKVMMVECLVLVSELVLDDYANVLPLLDFILVMLIGTAMELLVQLWKAWQGCKPPKWFHVIVAVILCIIFDLEWRFERYTSMISGMLGV